MLFPTRPASVADAPAIHHLVLECEGEGALDRVLADLRRPAIDLSRDTLLAHDESGELAGWAWVHLGRRAEIRVRPRHRGAGLGTRLLKWAEERAREIGSARLGQNVPDDDADAAKLLRDNGYQPKATMWQLEIALPAPAAPMPEDLAVRAFQAGDERAAYEMVEAAFADWQDRRRSYEEWARLTIERPDFRPPLSPLAFDGDRLVGAVLSLDGHIERVAVDREHRRRGIAGMLLAQAFQAFHEAGYARCVLWTHSETGAQSLYERVGMTVRRSSTHYSKAL